MSSKKRAVELLDHYITLLLEKQGLQVTSDIHVEIEEIVDNILDAAFESAVAAMRSGNQQWLK